MLHQVGQQRELFGRQIHESGPAHDDPAHRVECDVAGLAHQRRTGALAAQQRAYPRAELGEGKRLREVVVGSRVEALHTILDQAARREHQDRQVGLSAAQRRADGESVHPRQHDVENDQVVTGRLGQANGRLAVAGEIHRELILDQSLPDEGGEFRLIFHHQHAHGGW